MSVKTQRKIKAEPSSKTGTVKKTRRSVSGTTSKSNGKYPLAAYEHLHIGIVKASLDGTYIDANEEFCRILGYSKKELLRLGIRDCTHEDDYALDIKLHERLVNGEVPFYGLEKRFVRKDGDVIWVELTRSLIRDENGKPFCTIGAVLDISDRKQVERALRESAESLRLATEAARMFKWELDLQKQVYTFADNFVQVLGFSAGLLPQNSAESVWRLSPAEDVQVISKAIARAIKKRSDLNSLQYRVINPENGQTVWLEVNAQIAYDEEGHAQRMFGVAQNITENKKTQEELQIISRMPEENPNPVMRLTRNGQVLYANPASQPLVNDWTQPTGQKIPAELQKAIADAFTSGLKQELEIRHGEKIFSCTLAPMADSGYVNLYGKDITERKRSEQALAEYARQQEALYQLSDHLHHTNSLEDVYNAALDAILSGLRCNRASILLFDESGVMRFVAWRGLSDDYRRATEGHSPWKADEKNPYPICVGDLRTADLSDALKATIQKEGIDALVFIPLISNGRLIGKFMVYYNTPHDCSDVEIELSLMIARQIAFGVEHKRAEQAIRLDAKMLENVAAGIYLVSAQDGSILHTNPQFDTLFGYEPGEVIGKSVSILNAPGKQSPQEMTEEVIAALRKDGSWRGEVYSIRKDGTPFWCFASVTTFAHARYGTVWVAARQDITERKQAEEALRASEERHRGIVNQTIGGIAETDLTGKFVMVNDHYCEITGYRREQLLNGMRMQDITHPDDLPKNSELFGHLLSGGDSFEIEKRYVRPDGSMVWVHNSVSAIIGTDGEPHSAVAMVIDVTERKRVEDALRIENERFMRFVDANIVGILIGDFSGKVTFVNDYYLRLLGVSRQDFIAQKVDWKQFTPPEWAPADEKAIQELRERGICEPYEKEYVRADGTRVPVYIADAMLPGPREEVAAFVLDITERKRAEQALRQSEERFVRFMQHLPGLAWIKDARGRYIFANAAAEKAFGAPREKLYGKTDTEVFPPEVAVQFRQNDEQALVSEKGMQTVETLPQEDSVLHYSLVTKFPIPGPDGSTTLIGGTAFDITERLQAEEALRKSEERFRALVSQATAGIIRQDAEGRLTFVNQAFCNMLGYAELDLLGKTSWEFTHDDDVAENKRLYERMMTEGIPFKLEKRLLRADGSILWVDVSVDPVMDAEGRPESAVAVEVDITGRKQAEEALQQLNLQLENRVQKRTATIQAINQSLREEIAERKRIEEALRQSESAALASEEKLRTLFDLLPVGITFLDPEGKILQMNSAVMDIIKLSKGQLFSQMYKSRKYMHADGTPMPLSEFASARALRENRTIHNVETGIALENGEVIWTSVSAAPVDVADVGVVVVTVDITDTKRAERALKESHRRLRILSQRLVEVQEDERRALARELHDRVGQTLAALNINLIIINSQLAPEVTQQIGVRLNDSMKLVAETIALVRDVMTDLRPAVLDDYGLEAALESQLTKFTSRYNIKVAFEKSERSIPRLGPSVEMTLLRIAQEALMNIARHSHAERVNLSLRYDGKMICLSIHDDGIGIESWQEANRPGSHGLTIMRERADAFGGELRVSSVPGGGTTVEVTIPFKNDGPEKVEENYL